jgi:hypothetical protein
MRQRPLTRMVSFVIFCVGACASGCSKASPIQDLRPTPTPTPTPPVSVATQPAEITGWVYDTAWQPVFGAAVQLSDDANTRLETTSDGSGRFAFAGTFTSRVTVTADKNGFRSGTTTVDLRFANGRPVTTGFTLARTENVTLQTGPYALTMVAASECRDIPDDLRTRTYDAVVTAKGSSGSQYNVTPKAPGLFSSDGFSIGIAGDYVVISADEFTLYEEQPSPFASLQIYGGVEAHVEGSILSALSVPFDGTFSYCALKGPKTSNFYSCFQPNAEVAVASDCQSKNHRLILQAR